MKIQLFMCVMSLVLFACATTSDRLLRVEPGMDQKQVADVLGTPKDKTFRGTQEKWIYEGIDDKNKVVIFENGKVVELLNVGKGETVMHGKGGRGSQAKREAFCKGSNSYGKFAEGGGCNMYGCWPTGGYCNQFGCSASGRCTVSGCPKKIKSFQCVE